MIATLQGEVEEVLAGHVILAVGGIGYEVFVTPSDGRELKVGSPAKLYIYEQIREDAHNLYGFKDASARLLFESLLSVKGVGPKVAMAMLAASSADGLQRAIISGDPDMLKGISGVGKKTAERIMIELKGKLGGLEGGVSSAVSADSAYQALVGLGYTAGQAADAISKLPHDIKGDEARVKAALQGLAK